MTPNPRAKLYLDLRSHLRAAKFKFFERPRERQFLLLMRGDSVTVPVVVTVRPDGTAFRLQTKVPTIVVPERRLAAAQLVARLNARTQRGHYDLDLDLGEIDFRVDCHAPSSVVDRRSFLVVLKMTLDPVLLDFQAIDAVLARDADPKQAIDALERAHAAAKSAAERDAAIRQRKVDVEKAKDEDNPPRRRQRLTSFLDQDEADEQPQDAGPQPTPEELREIFDSLHGTDDAKNESVDEISDALRDELMSDDPENDEDPGEGPRNDPRHRPG
jgi:hypothetical protein